MRNAIVAQSSPSVAVMLDEHVRLIAQQLLSADSRRRGRALCRLQDLPPSDQQPYIAAAARAFAALDAELVDAALREAAQALSDAELVTGAPHAIDLMNPRDAATFARARHTVNAFLNTLARS